MNLNHIFENCIYNNYIECIKKYGDSSSAFLQTKFALKQFFRYNQLIGFTNRSNIRDILSEVVHYNHDNTLLNSFLDKFINVFLSSKPESDKEQAFYNALYVTLSNYNKNFVIRSLYGPISGDSESYNSFSRYYKNNNSVNNQVNYRAILQNTISVDEMFDLIIHTVLRNIIEEKDLEISNSHKEIEESISSKYSDRIDNFRLNPQGVNECREHIEKGHQQQFSHINYSLGNLYASMDIGNVRKNQEDSVIILTHPKNANFKILVVADGAGGHNDGEKASSYAVSHIAEWFEELSPNYYKAQNLPILQKLFNSAIQNISFEVNRTIPHAYSTFVGAIVTEENTIISNVGDSRAYIYQNGKLQQLTDDDNVAYISWKAEKNNAEKTLKGRLKLKKILEEKDNIRFHKDSNRITHYIGENDEHLPQSIVISNQDYETLILCSDGITDCLSDAQLKAICKKTPVEQLAKSLIQSAKNTVSRNYSLDSRKYNQIIEAGKDNASVAIYDNRTDSKSKNDDGR